MQEKLVRIIRSVSLNASVLLALLCTSCASNLSYPLFVAGTHYKFCKDLYGKSFWAPDSFWAVLDKTANYSWYEQYCDLGGNFPLSIFALIVAVVLYLIFLIAIFSEDSRGRKEWTVPGIVDDTSIPKNVFTLISFILSAALTIYLFKNFWPLPHSPNKLPVHPLYLWLQIFYRLLVGLPVHLLSTFLLSPLLLVALRVGILFVSLILVTLNFIIQIFVKSSASISTKNLIKQQNSRLRDEDARVKITMYSREISSHFRQLSLYAEGAENEEFTVSCLADTLTKLLHDSILNAREKRSIIKQTQAINLARKTISNPRARAFILVELSNIARLR